MTVGEVKKLLNNFTFVQRGTSAEELSEELKLDLARLRKIGQNANIKLE